ncbi:MAG: hypothetical protein IJ754_08015 [Bacteroidaceae bacterium]|nr:hypothetical protein [Bacteroidaceae bacterium]MBR1791680.1 hypothetical protein [Bacteroidaceae bacterium]
MNTFFIAVRTYNSVNNMGKELGEYVRLHYDHTMVTEDSFPEVVKDLKKKQSELEKKYPRCKPFEYNEYLFKDYYKHESPHIYVKPQNTYNDNVVYSLSTTVVRNAVVNQIELEQAGSPT